MNNIENSKYQLENKILNSLQAKKPVLKDPDQLTNDIMTAIQDNKSDTFFENRTVSFAYRLLVAATVCLLMVFGIEEYIFYDKVKSLEIQASSISKVEKSRPGLRSIIAYNAGVQNKVMELMLKPGHSNLVKLPIKTKLRIARFYSIDIGGFQLRELIRMRDMIQEQNGKLLNN